MGLPDHIAEFMQRNNPNRSVGVIAVSGGPDSVALAHLMIGLIRQGKIERLILAHVNHQLRGAESDADEAFVRSLPELWRQSAVSARSERIDVAALAKHDNLEEVARRERYRWLAQVARDEQATWVATGHNADDQAETVLFRLLRGSGVLGLGAMSECRMLDAGVSLMRPLLGTGRQQILEYLLDKQITYRVDSSNRDLGFTRNRLRLELLPLLKSNYNPAIVETLCRMADQARELHAEIAAAAGQVLQKAELSRAGDILVFAVDRLRDQTANLVREMFRLVWQREDWPMGDMDFERWQRLVEIVHGLRPACDFPGAIHVRRVGGVVQLRRGAS